jgi:hypothetical protein
MRFQSYLYLASAVLIGNIVSVNGTSLGSALTAGAASDSVVEYIGHSLMSGPAALYLRRNIVRPGVAAPLGVANIISLPAIVFSEAMSEDDIRAILSRSFAIVRGCFLRQTNLNSVLISGAKTFDAIVNGAPPALRETVQRVLTQVIHATFDDLEGKSIMIDNMGTFAASAESAPAVSYTPTNIIIGPQPLRHMGSTTLIVTVAGDELSRDLARFIQGGLVATEGAPMVMIGGSAPVATTVVATAATAEVVEAPTSLEPVGLTAEEEAEIARLYAAELADLDMRDDDAAAAAAAATAGAVDGPSSPEVRPPIPAQTVRLLDDDLPPFDPSTVADPQLREAMIASRQEYLAPRRPAVEDDESRAIAASFAEEDEAAMISAAVEASQQRVEDPADLSTIISNWIESDEDVSLLIGRLLETGMEARECEELAAVLAADYRS